MTWQSTGECHAWAYGYCGSLNVHFRAIRVNVAIVIEVALYLSEVLKVVGKLVICFFISRKSKENRRWP